MGWWKDKSGEEGKRWEERKGKGVVIKEEKGIGEYLIKGLREEIRV